MKEKRHAYVLRDIEVLIDKKATDLITNLNPNLGYIQDEPICSKQHYIAVNGKSNPEFLLNEYATNVLAVSYDPAITRKIIKLVQRLKKADNNVIDNLLIIDYRILGSQIFLQFSYDDRIIISNVISKPDQLFISYR